jgi:glycosyltransferase involved in cell wall biosynthesis
MMPGGRPRLPGGVAVVAHAGPWAIGGLPAYTRNLLARLPEGIETSCSARFLAASPPGNDYLARGPAEARRFGATPVTAVLAPRRALLGLRAAKRLVHHPVAHRATIAAAVHAWRASIDASATPRASVVHSVGAGWELLGFAALAVARRRGLPLTVWAAVHIGSWGDSALDLRLYRAADAVFVQTPAEGRHLERLGVASDRLFVCPLGPDCLSDGDGARFRAGHGAEGRPIVLFIGRKTAGKGYQDLCGAIAAVRERVPGAMLVAIGADGGPPRPALGADVLLDLGAADERTKADALAACEVMCLPSRDEAFGIAYVEAWSYGKPVVALDTPAARDIVSDRVTGLLVRDRAGELVDALSALLEDPARARELGAAGAAASRRRFTWEAFLDAHLRVFATVLERRSRG